MKHLFSILLVVFLAFNSSYSQPYDPTKVNKKAVALYDQGMERAQDGNLTLAAGLFLKAIETDKTYLEAYLSLAGVYGQLKNYKSGTDYYEKAFALDLDYSIEFKLPYSIQLAGMGEFEKALNAINEYLDKNPPNTTPTFKAA